MSNELKVNIVRAIANHYISRDEMDENLIYEQAGAIQEFLDMQMKLYEQLRTTTNTPHKLKINPENGEVIFGEGALIHCAGQCDYDKLSGIKEKGIMAGDFVGIPEFNNDESYFCADFYRADRELSSREFIDRISDSDKTTARGPFGKGLKNITKLAFIFDSNDELRELMDTDMYRPENSNHPMQSALKLLESYKGEKNGQVSAIPYGIPSAFISGIIAGDSLLQDNEYMEMIRAMFPNCYILNREGRIFFSPDLTPEQNKENQLECLKVIPEQEGWRKDRVKKTIEYLLSSAIEATEEITRTGIINEQVSNIAQLTKGKDEKSKGTEIG